MTNLKLLGAAMTAALALAGCGDEAGNGQANAPATPVATVAAPAGASWTETVTKTADGGFLMGNPNAPVKLVEYASLTCHVCAAFAQEGMEELKRDFIAPGKVSLEYRNYIRDPIDVAASLLVRCQGPAPYYQLTEQVFAEQPKLLDRAQNIPPAEAQRLGTLPPAEQTAALARAVGLDQFFRVRGIPLEKQRQCLSDQAAIDELTRINQTGTEQFQIQGTPTFVLNGKAVENATSWAALKPILTTAVGG